MYNYFKAAMVTYDFLIIDVDNFTIVKLLLDV